MEEVTSENFEAESKGEVLLDFWAPWCGPCKMMGTVLEDLQKEGMVKVAKVNVDEQRELASKFFVTSIPTLVLVRDGKEVERTVGYKGGSALSKWVRQAMEKKEEKPKE